MTSNEMHIDFRVKYNKVNSNKNKVFLWQEIDLFINDQTDKFTETRTAPEGNYKGEGFEESQKRLDDIRTVIKEGTTNATKSAEYPSMVALTLASFDRGKVVTLPSTGVDAYRKLVSDSSDTNTTCANRFNVPNRLFSSEIIDQALNDPFHKTHSKSPISELIKNDLRVFEDGFTVANINVVYVYQYPRIVYGSVDCALPAHTHREIVDNAVAKVDAVLNTGNYEKYVNSISKNE
jgi:hypothetical protein